VVSMFHYLEHVIDPGSEIAAARVVLEPGGYLVIEVPEPDSVIGRALGSFWVNWLQPQHLHLMPAANLRARLAGLGFTVLLEEDAHDPVELLAAAWMALDNAAPPEDSPWLARPPGPARRAARTAVIVAGVPLLVTAALADRLLAPIARRTGAANAYRLLARRD